MSTLSPDQVPDNWSAIAPNYENAFETLTSKIAIDVLSLVELQPGHRVIDVAAGTGAFSLLAARAGADVLATDFAPGMITRLRERIAVAGIADISAEVMDGQALTVPDASFDVSVSILGLIFFPDIPKGIAELRRVLRPGGRAAIVCWSNPRNLEFMTLLVRSIQRVAPEFIPRAETPVWARLAGEDVLRDEMLRAGFGTVGVTTAIKTLEIESPRRFWEDFTKSVPPLAYLFRQLGPERTAAAGRAYIESLAASSSDGVPCLSAGVCIGIGRV